MSFYYTANWNVYRRCGQSLLRTESLSQKVKKRVKRNCKSQVWLCQYDPTCHDFLAKKKKKLTKSTLYVLIKIHTKLYPKRMERWKEDSIFKASGYFQCLTSYCSDRMSFYAFFSKNDKWSCALNLFRLQKKKEE